MKQLVHTEIWYTSRQIGICRQLFCCSSTLYKLCKAASLNWAAMYFSLLITIEGLQLHKHNILTLNEVTVQVENMHIIMPRAEAYGSSFVCHYAEGGATL